MIKAAIRWLLADMKRDPYQWLITFTGPTALALAGWVGFLVFMGVIFVWAMLCDPFPNRNKEKRES